MDGLRGAYSLREVVSGGSVATDAERAEVYSQWVPGGSIVRRWEYIKDSDGRSTRYTNESVLSL